MDDGVKAGMAIADNDLYALLPELLLPWFAVYARDLPWRADRAPYHVWLSEIMLQQTRVDTVKAYYLRFLRTFPDVAALAAASEDAVLKLWEGLGYYSRARNLHRAAKQVAAQYGGRFPEDARLLAALPGVGGYSAGAIASICFELPVPAVDGNVLRIIARITGNDRCVDDAAVKKEIAANLARVYPPGRCGAFTQSLMELGATVCLPNGAPLCGACPVAAVCTARRQHTIAQLPVRKEKTARAVRDLTMLVLRHDGCVAVRKRTEKGLLHSLWEFPNIEGFSDEAAVRAWLHTQPGWEAAPRFTVRGQVCGKHIFTHVRWDVLCYHIDCAHRGGGFVWADRRALEREIALPTAFKKFIHFAEARTPTEWQANRH